MSAFLTGSRAYGTPRPNSDIDLVVTIHEQQTLDLLEEYSDGAGGSRGGDRSLRFGRLNLIALEEWEARAWRVATNQLQAQRPVTKVEAIALIEHFKSRFQPESCFNA